MKTHLTLRTAAAATALSGIALLALASPALAGGTGGHGGYPPPTSTQHRPAQHHQEHNTMPDHDAAVVDAAQRAAHHGHDAIDRHDPTINREHPAEHGINPAIYRDDAYLAAERHAA